MTKKTIFIFVSILLLMLSCKYFQKPEGEKPIGRVFNLYLYPSDIQDHIPDWASEEDSIRITRRMVEEWIRDQLLLKKAEQFLSGRDNDLEKQVANYRASLLTFKYKQELLEQSLDTIILNDEIEKYYNENSSNYLLNADMVKLSYIKIPASAPELSTVYRLYYSEKDEDLASLEHYCNAFAESAIIKSQNWINYGEFVQNTPFKTDNPGRVLTYNKNLEASDSTFRYFIHIFEYIPKSKTAPLEMVYNDIKTVLLNKRRITLLQEIESSIYKEGLSRNQAEIYLQ